MCIRISAFKPPFMEAFTIFPIFPKDFPFKTSVLGAN